MEAWGYLDEVLRGARTNIFDEKRRKLLNRFPLPARLKALLPVRTVAEFKAFSSKKDELEDLTDYVRQFHVERTSKNVLNEFLHIFVEEDLLRRIEWKDIEDLDNTGLAEALINSRRPKNILGNDIKMLKKRFQRALMNVKEEISRFH